MSTFDTSVLLKIKAAPDEPGVYFFKSGTGRVLYVGKAKSLKNRLRSYVSSGPVELKIEQLMLQARELDYQVLPRERDALILEASLIRAHQPALNVLLKSGQRFAYFFFSATTPCKFELVYDMRRRGKYFGPFLSRAQARDIFEALRRIFGLKVCTRRVANGCLDFHIGLCPGFCRQDFDLVAYLERIALVKKLCMQGPQKFLRALQEMQEQCVAALNFEKAAGVSAVLEALQDRFAHFASLQSISGLEMTRFVQQHIWLLSPDNRKLYLFTNLSGVVKKELLCDLVDQEAGEFIQNFYWQNYPAKSVFVNFKLAVAPDDFLAALRAVHGDELTVLFDDAGANPPDAVAYAMAVVKAEHERVLNLPVVLQKMLQLPLPVHTVDCFDISHHQGHMLVGACVRYRDGVPEHNKFRLFKIKTVEQSDDFACLREVVQRRYQENHDFPDLILIDGGKGQLSAVRDLWPEQSFAALAKKEERVFRPVSDVGVCKLSRDGLVISPLTPEGLLLIAARDRVHNFVLSYHQKLKTAAVSEE